MTSENEWTRTLFAGLVVGAALTIEHLLCYDEEEHRRSPQLVLVTSNIIGTLTIAAGIAVSGAPPKEIVRHITVAAVGGAFVVAIRAIRHQQEEDRKLRGNAHEAIGRSEGARNSGWSLGDPAKLLN